MKKNIMLIGLIFISMNMIAQQDITLSMYMFNPLFTNPATAGYQDKSLLNAIYRYQWAGFDGAPHSGVVSYQTPLKNENIALGFSGKFDKLGLMTNVGFDASFAYRLRLSERVRLSLGLMGSLFFLNDNRTSATVVNPGDPTISQNVNKALPNFGFGAYLFGERFFVGASIPHVLNLKIRDAQADSLTSTFSKIYNHYFASAGYVFGKEDGVKFKPTAFFKVAQGVSPNIDINANLLFQERFWIGLGYRSGGDVLNEQGQYQQFKGVRGESLIAIFRMMVTHRLELGYAYDYPLSNIIRTSTYGSHEFYLGIDVGKSASTRYISPRYVNYF